MVCHFSPLKSAKRCKRKVSCQFQNCCTLTLWESSLSISPCEPTNLYKMPAHSLCSRHHLLSRPQKFSDAQLALTLYYVLHIRQCSEVLYIFFNWSSNWVLTDTLEKRDLWIFLVTRTEFYFISSGNQTAITWALSYCPTQKRSPKTIYSRITGPPETHMALHMVPLGPFMAP